MVTFHPNSLTWKICLTPALAGYLFCQLKEEKLGTISKGFIYPSNKMRANANEKTQPSNDKARQCSVIKERASLLTLPDDLYAPLNQCEAEYKLVPSVTLLFDLRNETVTNLSAPRTNASSHFKLQPRVLRINIATKQRKVKHQQNGTE